MTFFRCRNGLRGPPAIAVAVPIRDESAGTALVTFASSSELSLLAGSTEAVPPLMGFVQSVPLRRFTVSRPLQDSVAADLWRSGAIQSVAFRPRGFSPPRRFAPRHGLRVCCTPQPAMGSDAFLSLAVPLAEANGPAGPFPHRYTPFEEFPSSAAVPCHHGRCPLVVTSHSTFHFEPKLAAVHRPGCRSNPDRTTPRHRSTKS
jgi:hypothetical protein